MLTTLLFSTLLVQTPVHPDLGSTKKIGILYQSNRISKEGGCESTWEIKTDGQPAMKVELGTLAHRALIDGGQHFPARVVLTGTIDGETFQAVRLENITRSMREDSHYPELRAAMPNYENPKPEVNLGDATTSGLNTVEKRKYITFGLKFSDVSGPEPHPSTWYTDIMRSTYPGVDHFYDNISNGLMDLSDSESFAWVTLPGTAASYKTGNQWDVTKLIAGATPLVDGSVDFRKVWGVNVFPVVDDNAGVSYATYTDVPSAEGTFYRPVTMNNPWADQFVLVHEMGHDMSFDHTGSGNSVYNSEWSPMGNGGRYWTNVFGDFTMIANQHNMYHKQHAGWLKKADIATVTPGTTKTVYLERSGSPAGNGKRVGRLLVPGVSTRYYTIESRKHETYDTASSTFGEAVIIHQIDRSKAWSPGAARVVDPDGNSNTGDASTMWTVGETFTGEGGVTVEVLSTDANGFTVRLTSPAGATPPGTVTNTNDSGAGSLRDALTFCELVGGGWDVKFNIPVTDPNYSGGVFRIKPASQLPLLASSDNFINGASQTKFTGNTNPNGPEIYIDGSLLGGYTHGLYLDGEWGFDNPANSNRIRGIGFGGFANGNGIEINGGDNNVITGCQFGFNATGTAAANIGNVGVGIWWHSRNNQVGGPNPGDKNVFGNCSIGVRMYQGLTSGNEVLNNWMGFYPDGSTAAGMVAGVQIDTGAYNNKVTGNTIGNCSWSGVYMVAGSEGNVITRNNVGMNAAGGIAPIQYGILTESAANNTIGSTDLADANTAVGCTNTGIYSYNSPNTIIQGNYVGRTKTQTTGYGNQFGITVDLSSGAIVRSNVVRANNIDGIGVYGSAGVTVGGAGASAGNTVSFNGDVGVYVHPDSSGTTIRRNSLSDNGTLGIDAGGYGQTPNDSPDVDGATNFPTFTIAGAGDKVQASVTLNAATSTTYLIDFYGVKDADSSGYGEGAVWLGSKQLTTNGSGVGSLTHTVGAGSSFTQVSATATNLSTNATSEFSLATTGIPIPVLTTVNVNGTVGSTVNLAGTLTNRQTGAALPGKSLQFWVNGSLVGSASTVAGTGTATLSYVIPSGLPASSELKVIWAGNASFATNTAIGALTHP